MRGSFSASVMGQSADSLIIQRVSLSSVCQHRPASTKSGLETVTIPRCPSSRGRRPNGSHRQLTPTLGLSSMKVELPVIFASDDIIVVDCT